MEKIRLKLKAYDHRVLDRSVAAIVHAVWKTENILRDKLLVPIYYICKKEIYQLKQFYVWKEYIYTPT